MQQPPRSAPVEPPTTRWQLPSPQAADRDGIVGDRRRPRTGHAVGGVPERPVPDALRPAPAGLVLARPAGDHPARRPRRQPLAAPQPAQLRRAAGHRLRRRHTALRRSTAPGVVDHAGVRARLLHAARTRLGALVRVVRRAGRTGRRPLRRAHRRFLRRRGDVPPRPRRLQGGARAARRLAHRDRRPADRRAVADTAPHVVGSDHGEPRRVPSAAGRRRSEEDAPGEEFR